MEVIGLLGYQGVGKNYIAENILNEILPKENTLIMAFADHFKIDCINKHNVEFNKIYLNKDIESRKLLQRVGTEEGRDIYGDDIWVNVLESWMRVYNNRGIKRFYIELYEPVVVLISHFNFQLFNYVLRQPISYRPFVSFIKKIP